MYHREKEHDCTHYYMSPTIWTSMTNALVLEFLDLDEIRGLYKYVSDHSEGKYDGDQLVFEMIKEEIQ